jgi:hypothetical protein
MYLTLLRTFYYKSVSLLKVHISIDYKKGFECSMGTNLFILLGGQPVVGKLDAWEQRISLRKR